MRKIIQLTRSNHALMALCNDGTVLRENGYNSGWDIVDYEVPQPVTEKKGKQVKLVPPTNFKECFEKLWMTKGRKGAKNKASEIYTKMSLGETSKDLAEFTQMLCNDIQATMPEPGFPELHLTTYLNQQRWVK